MMLILRLRALKINHSVLFLLFLKKKPNNLTLIKSISGIRGTIGGIAGNGLTPIDIVKFTAAYGSWIINKTNIKKIVVGRDARISGEMVNHLVIGTLQGSGN
jgi:phosphomannomutase